VVCAWKSVRDFPYQNKCQDAPHQKAELACADPQLRGQVRTHVYGYTCPVGPGQLADHCALRVLTVPLERRARRGGG